MSKKEYKPTMLTIDSYSALEDAKNLLKGNSSRRVTFTDVIYEYVKKRVIFEGLDVVLKEYIGRFVTEASKSERLKGIVLFGSVARGTFTKYSDIDLFILVDDDEFHYLREGFKQALSVADEMRWRVIANDLYLHISPLIVSVKKSKDFSPIFLDVLDYGLVLFERENTVSDFLSSLRQIKHKRTNHLGTEVLQWE